MEKPRSDRDTYGGRFEGPPVGRGWGELGSPPGRKAWISGPPESESFWGRMEHLEPRESESLWGVTLGLEKPKSDPDTYGGGLEGPSRGLEGELGDPSERKTQTFGPPESESPRKARTPGPPRVWGAPLGMGKPRSDRDTYGAALGKSEGELGVPPEGKLRPFI